MINGIHLQVRVNLETKLFLSSGMVLAALLWFAWHSLYLFHVILMMKSQNVYNIPNEVNYRWCADNQFL